METPRPPISERGERTEPAPTREAGVTPGTTTDVTAPVGGESGGVVEERSPAYVFWLFFENSSNTSDGVSNFHRDHHVNNFNFTYQPTIQAILLNLSNIKLASF